MRRWIILVAVIGAIAAASSALLRQEPEWTTSSSEALAALHDGLTAMDKVYLDDARRHFERAVEADSEFAVAKVFLGRGLGGERRKALSAELEAVDLDDLTERERFLVRHFTLVSSGKGEEAWALINERLAKYPKDRYALELRAHEAFLTGRWEDADRDYQKLVEVAPNWVTAYNQLGYSAMSQGRFDESEGLFRKYRFIAPDQANPHDSLAELLILLGRYEEAEQELQAALSVKPDFCASYQHMVTLGQLSGQLDLAEEAVANAAEVGGCADELVAHMGNSLRAWRAALAQDWRAVVDALQDCQVKGKDVALTILLHRAYLELGLTEDARALEDQLAYSSGKKMAVETPRPPLLYLEGARFLAEGRADDAARSFARADASLSYRGMDEGIFKLLTMASHSAALRASGDWEASQKVSQTVTEVNPSFATDLLAGLGIRIARPS